MREINTKEKGFFCIELSLKGHNSGIVYFLTNRITPLPIENTCLKVNEKELDFNIIGDGLRGSKNSMDIKTIGFL